LQGFEARNPAISALGIGSGTRNWPVHSQNDALRRKAGFAQKRCKKMVVAAAKTARQWEPSDDQ
jgi:hypothetical protein